MNPRGLGLRWQGGSRDTAFGGSSALDNETLRAQESGVALRFPPQSKTRIAVRLLWDPPQRPQNYLNRCSPHVSRSGTCVLQM